MPSKFFKIIGIIAALFASACGWTYDNLDYGAPGGVDQVVDRIGYALGFSKKYKQPLWVMYRLTLDEVQNVVVKRMDNFRFDENIDGGSATLEDYKGSGYDRGHLAPAADMRWSKEAMSDSFYMSNMSPQRPAFNRGVWSRLESFVRDAAISEKSIVVITGPLFDDEAEKIVTIGTSNVRVPEFYYKVVYDETPPVKMIGFIIRNNGSASELYRYACSVDEVEEATGLDFFSALDEGLQIEIEKELNLKNWFK